MRHRWSAAVPSAMYRPPVVGTDVVLAETTWEVTGLAVADGAVRWRLAAGAAPRQFAWAVPDAAGAVMCAGHAGVWRVTALDHAGATRYSWILECRASAAIAVDADLWLLTDRGGDLSRLQRLDPAGAVLGSWPVPAAGCGLQAEGDALIFVVRGADQPGLYRFDPRTQGLACVHAGAVDSVVCADGYRLVRLTGPRTLVLDERGRERWAEDGLGLLAQAQDGHVYCCRQRDGSWRPTALDLATGAVRWEVPWDGASEYLQVMPFGSRVGVWDNGAVALLDHQTGATVQTLTCPSGMFSGVGPEGYGHGLLGLAEQATVHCYEVARP